MQVLRLSTNSTPSQHLGLPLTHPPRLRSQGARVLRTNSPRQSTRAWTMAGWACRTQSTASPAATEYRDTTLPHVMPAGRETDAGQQKAATALAPVQPSGHMKADTRSHLPHHSTDNGPSPPLPACTGASRLRGASPPSHCGAVLPPSRAALRWRFPKPPSYTCSPVPEPRPTSPSPPSPRGEDSKAVQEGGN